MAVSTIDPNGLNIGQIGGRRRLNRNGAMIVSQRGSTFSNLASGAYCLDGVQANWGLSGWTATQDSDAPDGFSKSLKIVPDSAATPTGSDYACIDMKIEAQDLHRLDYGTSNAQTLVLSFWVKSNVTGQYAMNAYARDGNSGGARQRNSAYTINSSGVWEYKTIVIPGDTDTLAAIDDDNGEGYRITFFLCVGTTYTGGTTDTWANWTNANFAAAQQANVKSSTSNYWQITGVQLEVGDVATPFEHRSYAEELNSCLRYYYKRVSDQASGTLRHDIGILDSATAAIFTIHYPVVMRAVPSLSTSGTFTLESTSSSTVTSFSTYSAGPQVYALGTTSGSVGTKGYAVALRTASTSAYLAFDAEL